MKFIQLTNALPEASDADAIVVVSVFESMHVFMQSKKRWRDGVEYTSVGFSGAGYAVLETKDQIKALIAAALSA